MRAAKLAMARKKLKEHQEKKHTSNDKDNVEDQFFEETSPSKCSGDGVNSNLVDVNEPIGITVQTDIPSNLLPHDTRLDQQLKAMEILTINKRQLENQVFDLLERIKNIESKYVESVSSCTNEKQYSLSLEAELKTIKDKNYLLNEEILSKSKILEDCNASITSLKDKNNNLSEQIDITKTALMSKENENASLQSLISNLQSKLEVTELHLQQLNNGTLVLTDLQTKNDNFSIENEKLSQKNFYLEEQLKSIVNEKDQLNIHYEQYVSQLNEQLLSISSKNDKLMLENQMLSNRENSLIDQISDMEKQLQQLKNTHIVDINTNKQNVLESQYNSEFNALYSKYVELETELQCIQKKYGEAQKLLLNNESANQVQHSNASKMDSTHMVNDVDISKLNADIVSDKVAAQRATAQNKQLKREIEGLHELYIKMSQDKLELTEKLDAEKFLNRELTLKLSETEDKVKDIQAKLNAKDTEMIRLLSNYNDIEKKLLEQTKLLNTHCKEVSDNVDQSSDIVSPTNMTETRVLLNEQQSENPNYCTHESDNAFNISINEAMLKLQERFLKNMKEVADLSDEKHRLEHIILQLQSETDTICEYVALYQQQRGILKRREEERKQQLNIFEIERDKMKKLLEDLSRIISHFTIDEELQKFFQKDSRKEEVAKIINLVNNMRSNLLVDSSKQYSGFQNFYPCSLCSGNVTIV